MNKRRKIELTWRKTGAGHYEETTFGFVIAQVHSRRWQILDPHGREIYGTRERTDAENFFVPIPEEVGKRVQVSDYEWQGSIAKWMLTDYTPIGEKSGPPDVDILPPVSLPQATRRQFMYFEVDSLKNAWLKIVREMHPAVLEKYSCRECGRPALDNTLCAVCHWLEQDYHKTLYKP